MPVVGIEDLSPAPKAVYGAVLYLMYHHNPPTSVPSYHADGKIWTCKGADGGVLVDVQTSPGILSVHENKIDDAAEERDRLFRQMSVLKAGEQRGTLDTDQKAQLDSLDVQVKEMERLVEYLEDELKELASGSRVWMVRDSGVERMPPLWKEITAELEAQDPSDLI
jgi:hypothetical protein